jgi:drug/metabolite transporter (DMT)-like permease
LKRVTASIFVLIGAASFGVLSTILKLGYQHGFTVGDITGGQIVFGCVVLWLFSFPYLKQLRQIPLKTVGLLVLCGIFPGLTGALYYLALQSVSASLGVILLFQFVWMGMFADWLIQRRVPTRNQWLALVLVMIGTVLAAGYQAMIVSSTNLVGVVFALLAALSYTGNLQVSGRVATHVPAILRSTLMMTGAVLVTFIIFPPQFFGNGSLGQGLWLWAILMGLLGVVIPPYLFARGIPRIGPGLATILGSIELPVVITGSALILREPVELSQWFGVVLILVGIFFSERRVNTQK